MPVKKKSSIIDLGQRVCPSGMMIEIAFRLGPEPLPEGPAFQDYPRSAATSSCSFNRVLAGFLPLLSIQHVPCFNNFSNNCRPLTISERK